MSRLTNEARLLQEYLRRQVPKKIINLADPSFPAQTKFIRDSSRFKAAQCTRRAAKSYGAGIGLFEAAVNNDRVSCLYLGMTVESARNIMIKDIMEPLDQKYNLKAKFYERPLVTELPNGSLIYYTGVDASEKEKKKLWGQKYKRVVLDEGGGYSINVEELINSVLRSTLIDYQGDLWFMGMPTNNINSYFFNVVNGKVPGWSVHKWSALENPYIKDQFQSEMDQMIAENPLVIETPWFRQMYLNEWVIDLSAIVYKFNSARNLTHAIPVDANCHVLGVDLGYEDDTSFSIVTFSEKSKELFGTKSYKKKGMDLFEVSDEIKSLQNKYKFYKIKIDGSNKQAVETMRKRLGLPYLEAADKTGKAEHIEILNSELIQGKIKLIESECQPLIKEWQELIWDEKKDKKTEHSACANHCADSFLYAWRETWNYLSNIPDKKPEITSDQYMQEFLRRESESMMKKEKESWIDSIS